MHRILCTKALLPLIIGLCLLSNLQAQTTLAPGTQADVTLAITASYTIEKEDKILRGNTVQSGILTKENYTNKAFLTDLNDADFLPDHTIVGWKLVLVNRNPTSRDSDRAFYLVKTNKTPVLLPDNILNLDVTLPGYAATYTETENSNGDILSASTTAIRAQVGLTGSIPGTDRAFTLRGVFVGSDRSGPVTLARSTYIFIDQYLTGKLTGIVGHINAGENEDATLLEGSITFGPEKPLDVTTYPAAVAP
jgi:hypothetical protein